jgi:hypothetical protein
MDTPGHFQFIFKNIAPGDGAMLLVELPGIPDISRLYAQYVGNPSSMPEFGRTYLGSLNFSGENVESKNNGLVKDVASKFGK